MTGVVVLNASYEPLQVVSLKHAVKMLCRSVAVVEEADGDKTIGPFPYPKILRLVRYVYVKIKGSPRYSRASVLRRDNFTCAFCGGAANTIDHIVPRSKGGESSWLNSISACKRCNERKRDRTPKEAGMKLLYEAYVPTHQQLKR